jgi:hypothetical protein
MERARAEGTVAVAHDGAGSAERAYRLDPALGQRMAWRRDLHAHLRAEPVLPSLATTPVLLRVDPQVEVEVVHDRIEGDGRWTRIRAVFAGTADLGLARVGDQVVLDPGVPSLFTRMGGLEITALFAALSAATAGRVRRVSRGQVGPFWFPGVELPPGVSPKFGAGIVLHLVWTALGDDVAGDSHADLLEPRVAPGGWPPGYHLAHQRRLVGQGAAIPGLEPLA